MFATSNGLSVLSSNITEALQDVSEIPLNCASYQSNPYHESCGRHESRTCKLCATNTNITKVRTGVDCKDKQESLHLESLHLHVPAAATARTTTITYMYDIP